MCKVFLKRFSWQFVMLASRMTSWAVAAFAIGLTVGVAPLAAEPHQEGELLRMPPIEETQHDTRNSNLVAYNSRFLGASEKESEDGPEEISLSTNDRIDQLVKQYEDLSEKYSDLADDHKKLGKSLKGYAKTGHSDATMRVSGRVHFDAWGFPGDSPGVNAFENGDPTISPQDRIGFRRVRFGVAGDIWHNMLYKIEMEFAGGNESEFRDVYLGWKDVPLFQKVLLGNQKRPYGLDHLNSSRYNVFLERPFIIESFNQDARRLGLQSYGVSEDQAWNWRYGVFNQRLIQDEGNFISDHWQLEVAGRLAHTFWYDEASDGRGYGHWAISGSAANPDGSNTPGRATNEARFRQRPEARSTERWLDTGTIDGADNANLIGLESVWRLEFWRAAVCWGVSKPVARSQRRFRPAFSRHLFLPLLLPHRRTHAVEAFFGNFGAD